MSLKIVELFQYLVKKIGREIFETENINIDNILETLNKANLSIETIDDFILKYDLFTEHARELGLNEREYLLITQYKNPIQTQIIEVLNSIL